MRLADELEGLNREDNPPRAVQGSMLFKDEPLPPLEGQGDVPQTNRRLQLGRQRRDGVHDCGLMAGQSIAQSGNNEPEANTSDHGVGLTHTH